MSAGGSFANLLQEGRVLMKRKLSFATVMVAATMFCVSAGAQMVVHAMSGMVKAVNPDSKTMDVTVDNGDTSQFKLPTKAKVTLDFDKALQLGLGECERLPACWQLRRRLLLRLRERSDGCGGEGPGRGAVPED